MKIIEDKYLYFCYDSMEKPKQLSFEQHMHNAYEILYFIKGNADYMIGSYTYHLSPHNILFIRPAVYHSLKLKSDDTYERFVINFPHNILPNNINLDDFASIYQLPDDKVLEFNNLFSSLIYAVDNFDNKDSILALISQIKLILLHLKYVNKKFTKTASTGDTFSSILEYIDNNLTKNITYEDLCNKFFVSQSWISHKFIKTLGLSPINYINQKKILYAQQLIMSGVQPTQASDICGYENYSTFYRQYKKFLKTEPTSNKPI